MGIKDLRFVTVQEVNALRAAAIKLESELARYSMSAGHADQMRAEARSARKSLGINADSEQVSPNDITNKIEKLKFDNEQLTLAIIEINQTYKNSSGYEPSLSVFHRALWESTQLIDS